MIVLTKINNKKIIIEKKTPTAVQICRLENIEHKSMKQVSYSGKYSLSARRAHYSHLQLHKLIAIHTTPLPLYTNVDDAEIEGLGTFEGWSVDLYRIQPSSTIFFSVNFLFVVVIQVDWTHRCIYNNVDGYLQHIVTVTKQHTECAKELCRFPC